MKSLLTTAAAAVAPRVIMPGSTQAGTSALHASALDGHADVLVIGAGAAGLAAAAGLRDRRYRVIVLEARERIGGRIWTDHALGTPVDLGATWIHGTEKNRVYELTRSFGIATRVTDYDSMARYDTDGSELSLSEEEALEERYEEIEAQVVALRKRRDADRSLGSVIDSVMASGSYDSDERRQLAYSINTEIEHEYAADVTHLSHLYWDAAEEFEGGDVLMPGGYIEMFQALSRGLDIRLGEVVRRVSYDDRGVIVTTSGKTYSARMAIISVPLGVLQSEAIEFSPSLPAPKLAAIRRLGMGLLNKVALRFPNAFWDSEHLIGYVPREHGQWAEWLNLHRHMGEPLLVGFNAGTFARQIESWSDERVVGEAMTVLRTIYDGVPEPVQWRITRWGTDPHARGAYTYIPAGATPQDYDTMAEPVGKRLLFAGEATSRAHPATVHGAFLSGLREAQRIASMTRPRAARS